MSRFFFVLLISVISTVCGNLFLSAQYQTSFSSFSLISVNVNETTVAVTHVVTSPLNFQFPFPLLECTVSNDGIFVVAYPRNQETAMVYHLDSKNLNVVKEWHVFTNLFDFQFDLSTNNLYGIIVTSRFGRMLSHINYNNEFSFDGIVTLPYMWYINASSFDSSSHRYFGLLNNFPGPNSTLSQKLLVSNVVTNSSNFVDVSGLSDYSILHYIGWWSSKNELLGYGTDLDGLILGIIDTVSGIFKILFRVPIQSSKSGISVSIGSLIIGLKEVYCFYAINENSELQNTLVVFNGSSFSNPVVVFWGSATISGAFVSN